MRVEPRVGRLRPNTHSRGSANSHTSRPGYQEARGERGRCRGLPGLGAVSPPVFGSLFLLSPRRDRRCEAWGAPAMVLVKAKPRLLAKSCMSVAPANERLAGTLESAAV